MVKSRKTTLNKARPLPDRYTLKATNTAHGAKVSRRFTTVKTTDQDAAAIANQLENATESPPSQHGSTGFVSKRIIFPHLTRLQYGILRYRDISESPTSVITSIFPGTQQDRRFVFVPAGYSNSDKCLQEILMALQLNKGLPPLVIVTAATEGAVEETVDEDAEAGTGPDDGTNQKTKQVLLGNPISDDLDLSEEEERELLREKTQEILRSTVELCGETGAWLLPHRPRRVNGAAEVLCSTISSTSSGEDQPVLGKNPTVILGMIGLDHNDEENGFAQLIQTNMVPFGTEVEQVAIVNYDRNVRDNLPCPELTHLLLFERRQEMRDFRERLLSQTPDVFMAFGSTTPYAKKCLFATLVDESPVALITHTSSEIDHMSWMLRHADSELRKIDVGAKEPPEKGTATFAVSSDPTEYETLPLQPFADLANVDRELAEYLPVWPAAHRDERVVLADPRRVGGLRFQRQLLRAVNAAFYVPEARAVALRESSELLVSIQEAACHQNRVTEIYHLAMVLATLAAIVASVMYAKIFGEDPAPSWDNRNPRQIALFLVTLAVPFSIAYLKRLYDGSSQQWSDVQRSSAELESTIFEFRARPRTFGQTTGQAGGQEPLDAFIGRVLDIQSRASQFLAPEDGGKTSKEPGDCAAESPVSETVLDSADQDIEAPPPTESSPLLPAAPSPSLEDLALNGSTNKWTKKPHYKDDTVVETYEDEFQETPGASNGTQNDCATLLTIIDYIDCRVLAARQQKRDELDKLEKRNKIIEVIIKLVLGSTSLLALLSEQWFIPIVLGVSTAFFASQDFRKYRSRMDQGQAMIRKLDELLSWWDALDVEDKILPINEDRLVESAESILVAEVAYTY
ncbi:expressed unknown protein [Seminavis robusta]|uniref:SMODS and SLOG-associating 2TM effector domain-containing protein n=1 Tax=Seminavis robusta TaxID=568900 RepID=A0A9N8DUB5_9STRA|nr:expressed unknown protein [Seminavis robusta]|eukprot:Sro254_g100120.1 n/a (856) ;mRNA; f:21322-23889